MSAGRGVAGPSRLSVPGRPLQWQRCRTRSRSCCSQRPAATARASTGPSRRSNGRSKSTVRRSTCARRSSTTSTSSMRCGSAGRSSSKSRPKCRRGPCACSRPTASPPASATGADQRGLLTIDATCPLVTKVHREALRFAEEGYTIVLVGHDGHEEVEGTMGEAPERIVLVQDERRRRGPRGGRP